MSERSNFIGFLSDFGVASVYQGIVKGLVKRINPEACVVDLMHSIPPFDVELGAFFLYSSFRWFPEKTIFLSVVDPGVGGSRNALIVKTKRYFFVGPDNGIIYPAAVSDGIVSAYSIRRGEYTLNTGCETFHGRDIFAPAAAHLSLGVPLEELGEKSDRMMSLELPEGEIVGGEIESKALSIDAFGNVITNIRSSTFESFSGNYGEFFIKGIKGMYARTFEELSEGVLGCIPGSLDVIEICSKRGNAAEILSVKRGDQFRIVGR